MTICHGQLCVDHTAEDDLGQDDDKEERAKQPGEALGEWRRALYSTYTSKHATAHTIAT